MLCLKTIDFNNLNKFCRFCFNGHLLSKGKKRRYLLDINQKISLNLKNPTDFRKLFMRRLKHTRFFMNSQLGIFSSLSTLDEYIYFYLSVNTYFIVQKFRILKIAHELIKYITYCAYKFTDYIKKLIINWYIFLKDTFSHFSVNIVIISWDFPIHNQFLPAPLPRNILV